MTGIIGMVGSEEVEVLGARVNRMARPMLRQPQHRLRQKVAPGAALAVVGPWEADPDLAEAGDMLLAVCGEIVGLGGMPLQPAAGRTATGTRPGLAETLLSLVRTSGPAALCGLNGLYVICLWESRPQRLTIVIDRHGFRKLYYWQSRKQLAFASEYKVIAAQPEFTGRLNPVAVADLLQVNCLLDERTFFEDVQLVPPASVLTYQAGSLTIQRYGDYDFGPCGPSDEAACAEAYHLRLREAVRRWSADQMCLQVTGGLDSRSLAGTLSAIGGYPNTAACTVGHAHAYDVRFGRQVAHQSGLEHAFIPVEPDYVSAYARECAWRLEGSANCYTAWIFAEDDFLRTGGFQFVMNGFLGESITGDVMRAALREMASADLTAERVYHCKYNTVFTDGELAELLEPGVYRAVRGESYASIRRTLEATPSEHILNKILYVDLRQIERRFISSHIDASAEYCRVLNPFADNDFFDFALRLPIEMKLGQRGYKQMILRYLPHVARVPYTDTGLPLNAVGLRRKALQQWARIGRGLRRLPDRLLGRRAPAHSYRATFHYTEWLRTASRSFVTRVLSQRDCLADLFNVERVDRFVADFMEGRESNYRKLCALVTFVLWRQQFSC